MATHAIAGWATAPMLRMLPGGGDINLVVAAFHNLADSEIASVGFSIAVNSGAPSVTTVTTRTLSVPSHFAGSNSPLTGVESGRAPVWGYAHVLAASAYADGDYIDVTPTANPTTGTSYTLETQRYWCHKTAAVWHRDGEVCYVDPVSGNDANDGLTTGTAVQTLMGALAVATQESLGQGIADQNISGFTIYLMAGTHIAMDRAKTYWWSGCATDIGTHYTITRAPGTAIDDVILESGSFDWDTIASLSNCLIHGVTVNQQLKSFTTTSGPAAAHTWIFDSCKGTSHLDYWGIPGIRVREKTPSYQEMFGVVNVGTGVVDVHCFCCEFNAVVSIGARFFQDNVVVNVVGVATNHFAGSDTSWINNDISVQRTSPNMMLGNILVSGTGGTLAVVADGGGAGVSRITATGGGVYDFELDAAHLNGGTGYQLSFSGFTDAGNNGQFNVVGSGRDGSNLPYVDVTNGSAVSATSNSGSSMRTWDVGGAAIVDIHGDCIHWAGVFDNGVYFCNRYYDWGSPQTHFMSEVSLISNVAVVNELIAFGDATVGHVRNMPISAPVEHVLFRDCTIIGNHMVDSTNVVSGEINNCIHETSTAINGTLAAYAAIAAVDNNHRLDGGAEFGSNSTVDTGIETFADPAAGTSGQAQLDAGSAAVGSGNAAWDRPTEWYQGDKGVWANVASGDWGLATTVGGDYTLQQRTRRIVARMVRFAKASRSSRTARR